jgi:hypothetical protein
MNVSGIVFKCSWRPEDQHFKRYAETIPARREPVNANWKGYLHDNLLVRFSKSDPYALHAAIEKHRSSLVYHADGERGLADGCIGEY